MPDNGSYKEYDYANKSKLSSERIKNLENDYVNIPIEILSDNKISMNRLLIDDT